MSVNHQLTMKKRNQNKKKSTETSIKINNGVIITVYIESKTVRPHQKSKLPIKKQSSSTTKTCYDRRAQLLAYSRQLRESKSDDKVQWSRAPLIKPKARLRIGFINDFNEKSRWRGTYQRIMSMEEEKTNNNDKRKNSHLCRRLRCMFKDLLGCKNSSAL
ncbi:hypothetical protein ACFE04_012197 [Oxalis oulophora]